MKKYTAYKTIQLILFLLLTAAAVLLVFVRTGVYRQVATDANMRVLCMVLWAVLGLSFLFIFLDYSYFFNYRKDYREMEYALHSDPESGIANRFSCDVLINQYLGRPLPQNLGVISFELSNIREINELYGHLRGDRAINDFSSILRLAAQDLCFIGRNGGNRFLAVFENSTPEAMQKMLDRVEQKIAASNKDLDNTQLSWSCGTAYSNDDGALASDIAQLIALSVSRISETR